MDKHKNALLAAQILENEAWDEAYTQLESALVDNWKASEPDAWKVRESIYERLQALKDVRAQLETFLATGQFARKPN